MKDEEKNDKEESKPRSVFVRVKGRLRSKRYGSIGGE
jgi:hypothetical protein